jgi:hypothetical protein
MLRPGGLSGGSWITPRIGVNNLKAPLITMQYTGVNNTHKFVGTGRVVKIPDDEDQLCRWVITQALTAVNPWVISVQKSPVEN